MNKKKKLIYLAGAMEKRADNGQTWRRSITPLLEAAGYAIFNPCREENHIFDKYNLKPAELKNLSKGRNVELYQGLGKDLVLHDLKAIENSDILIVYYDEAVNKSSGTVSEMTVARLWSKPVYVIKDISYKQIPVWTMGCVTKFFNSIQDCVDYMKISLKIEKDKIEIKKDTEMIPVQAESKKTENEVKKDVQK